MQALHPFFIARGEAMAKQKNQKNIIIRLFEQAGYKPTEERIEKALARAGKGEEKAVKAVIKNEKEKQRRQRNRQQLQKIGVSDAIIAKNRLDTKNFDKYTKKELQKFKRDSRTREREMEKAEALKRAGVKNPKKTDLRKSWEKLADKYNIDIPGTAKRKKVPEGRTYLYVGFADTTGNGFDATEFKGYTVEELQQFIVDMVEGAAFHPDGSDAFGGVFFIDYGPKEVMEKRAEVNYSRGYNFSKQYTKLDDKAYMKLTVSNRWTEQEYLRMVATCFAHMKNSDILHYYDVFRDYCTENGFDYMNF